MDDLYEVLGIAQDASPRDIKTAYRKLAARHHPDRAGGDTVRFQAIERAYRILSDPEKRAAYDRGELKEQASSDISPERQEMIQILSVALEAVLQSGQTGPLTEQLREGLNGAIEQQKEQIKLCSQAISYAQRRHEALTLKAGGDDLLLVVLQAAISRHTSNREKMQAKLSMLQRFTELMDAYTENTTGCTRKHEFDDMQTLIGQMELRRSSFWRAKT